MIDRFRLYRNSQSGVTLMVCGILLSSMHRDDPPVLFFETPADFRRWLRKNHRTASELWVGFHRKGSGKPSLTWPESVDEALSFGWIDGIRKRMDDQSYRIRFTPRKPRSVWSTVNIRRAEELIRNGRMSRAGIDAFERRSDERTGIYAFEQKEPEFDRTLEEKFRSNRTAWRFFQALPPGYRRICTAWVMSAKREETRVRRLTQLVEVSAAGQRLPQIAASPAKKK